ncbi:family 43 glycosylhydrolase [Nonomuraea sp. NPDC049695]|uniref:family 43 glycosylhydrolase n=1 Tax=Nonomuraea sp. NPDC049695 TaxID=3154734 RepID=UPI0034407E58
MPSRGSLQAYDRVVLPPVLVSGTSIGPDAVLSTGHPDLEVREGVITSRSAGAVQATISVAGAEGFAVTVLPEASTSHVVSYTREPDPDPAVYSAPLAFSMHLALSSPGDEVRPLNDDHGVLFPRAVMTDVLDVRRIRTLADPHLFHTPAGYGVVATPCLPDGTPEPYVLICTTPDLVHYEEVGVVDLGTGGRVSRPRAVYDGARDEYVLWWTDGAGERMFTTMKTLDAEPLPARPGSPLVPASEPPALGEGRRAASCLPVDESTADRLARRFQRVRNVAVVVPELRVNAGERTDPPAARLSYSDGSTADRPVDWDTTGVDWDTPGEYPITGRVRQREYAFPFIPERADPAVLPYRGRYYFIATDDAGGDCVNTTRLLIRVADTVQDLATAADHAILTVGQAGIGGCFWAPELHVIDGRLHCFFSPSVGAASWDRVQSQVMRLRADGDPVLAADWEPPRPVLKADGSPLQLDRDHPGISLDMTYFEDAGRGYVAWSQRYITDRVGDAEIWIATVDPADPWRLTSDPVRLISAEYGWDLNDANVAEGPFVVRHGDRIVMTYSGSAVGPTYVMGLATAASGGDLLDPANWTKLNAPVLATDPRTGEWGPGHNTFSHDEDGLPLVVYHALTAPDAKGRNTAIRRVHWAADGRPVLDMRPDEEVAPHLRTVSTSVRVIRPVSL